MTGFNCDKRKSNSDVGQELVQHQKHSTASEAKQKQPAAVDMHKKALKCGKCGYTQKMSENVFYLVALLGLLNNKSAVPIRRRRWEQPAPVAMRIQNRPRDPVYPTNVHQPKTAKFGYRQ